MQTPFGYNLLTVAKQNAWVHAVRQLVSNEPKCSQTNKNFVNSFTYDPPYVLFATYVVVFVQLQHFDCVRKRGRNGDPSK